MSDLNFKEKYLKYKSKYLELKESQESQEAGYAYLPGKYIYFIPENMSNIVDSIDKSNYVIKSLDKFTTSLGNCTKFVRVGTTTTGNDISHKFDTIYTNQSSTSVAKREAGKAYDTTSQAAKSAYDTTKQAVNSAYDSSYKAVESVFDKNAIKNKYYKSHTGGENDCDKSPLRLAEFGLENINSDNNINDNTLASYTKVINNFNGTLKIGRIILVEKTGMFGVVNLLKDYKVNYNGDNISNIEKIHG